MSTLASLWRQAGAALAGVANGLATGLLALLILFEEWGWDPLQRALAWLGQWPVLRQIEAAVSRLPSVAALVLLLLPTLLLLPVKLLALWLMARGQPWLGLGVVVLAKLVGTAVLARLFVLTKPALLRLAWFAALYGRWVPWKNALLLRVRSSRTWRAGQVFKRALLRAWQRAWVR